jgi:hypothetical protein
MATNLLVRATWRAAVPRSRRFADVNTVSRLRRSVALQGFGRQWLETKKNHRTEVTASVLISDQGLASAFGLSQPGRGRVCTPSTAAVGIEVQSPPFFKLVRSPIIVGRLQLLRDHRALRASPSSFHGSPDKAILEESAASAPVRGADGADALQGIGQCAPNQNLAIWSAAVPRSRRFTRSSTYLAVPTERTPSRGFGQHWPITTSPL